MSQVFLSPDPDKDPEMMRAIEQARSMVRFFIREIIWENHRIVPGLGLACVKVPFSDPPSTKHFKVNHPQVEQMWVGEVGFDGEKVNGRMALSPQ